MGKIFDDEKYVSNPQEEFKDDDKNLLMDT